MKNSKLLTALLFLIFTSIIDAQSFKLLGERSFNLNNWLYSEPYFGYSDSAGNPYFYFKVNNNENKVKTALIKYDLEKNKWEDILGESYFLGFAPIYTRGKGLEDGSLIAVSKSASTNTDNNSLYKVFPDGTHKFIGTNPVPSGLTPSSMGPYANLTIDSKGTVYYAEESFFGEENEIRKWTGSEWVKLPDITEKVSDPSITKSIIRKISIVKTKLGEVYAAYNFTTEDSQGKTMTARKIVKLNKDETEWQLEHIIPSISSSEDLTIMNNKLSMVTLFYIENVGYECKLIEKTNNGWKEVFPPFITNVEGRISYLKTSDGEGYITNSSSSFSIYKYNSITKKWEKLENDIADRGRISGAGATLIEGEDGKIYNIFSEDIASLTAVVYDAKGVGTTTSFQASNIEIYPNPFENSFNIDLPKGLKDSYSYEISDLLGKRLLKESLRENKVISTHHFEQGLYLFTIRDGRGNRLITKKIVKR